MPEQLLRHETLSLSLDIVYVVDIASVLVIPFIITTYYQPSNQPINMNKKVRFSAG